MNFFAHAYVAAARSDQPRFLLGAMLPDLVGMMRARIAHLPDHEVQAGVRHHHEADAAFHSARTFTQLCSDAMVRLTDEGLERGSARAVSHVGIELVLDGLLSSDRAARERYAAALTHAAQADAGSLVVLRDPTQHQALRTAMSRLLGAPIPEGYRDPDFVAARLRNILAGRPRLALREGDLPAVRAFARDLRDQVATAQTSLLGEVHEVLENVPS